MVLDPGDLVLLVRGASVAIWPRGSRPRFSFLTRRLEQQVAGGSEQGVPGAVVFDQQAQRWIPLQPRFDFLARARLLVDPGEELLVLGDELRVPAERQSREPH